MGEHRVYRGFLAISDYGADAMSVLGLEAAMPPDNPWRGLTGDPLAMQLQEDREEFGPYASVRYFVSDEERSADELVERLVRRLAGDVTALYVDHYSDITGYLWTDQEIKVGGHDLLDELESYEGKFLHLEIEWSTAPDARS